MRRLPALILTLLSLGALHVCVLLADVQLHPAQPADVAVVLGNTVNPDGTLSPRLEARMSAALRLYERNWVRYVLVSGATGVEGLNEAEVMQSWLLGHGVPGSAVLVDRDGANTHATAEHTYTLLAEKGLRTAVVVTSYYHVPRTRLAVAAAGVDVTGAESATLIWEPREVYAIGREIAALYQYGWAGWL